MRERSLRPALRADDRDSGMGGRDDLVGRVLDSRVASSGPRGVADIFGEEIELPAW